MWFRCAAAAVILLAGSTTTSTAQEDTSNWYNRYPAYPEYCSTPDEMEKRVIPSLNENNPHLGDTRLVHVTSIIRHGARTPYASNLDCWDGYWENPDTGVWNCDLKTKLAATNFILEKVYDGLHSPLKNELNGTCQVGQLLKRGFQQELDNGMHLRNAYLYDGSSYDHNPRMRLLDINDPLVPQLYYRSDDDQRTVMSGQVLLHGLLGQEGADTTIKVHTADRAVDILSPNERDCPRLQELHMEAQNSPEYRAYNRSDETVTLQKFMEKELGRVMEKDAMDCIMTTICTDRPLPDAIDDFGRNNTDNLLQRLYKNDIYRWGIPWLYKDAAFPKLAMGPLWKEILTNIMPFIDTNDQKDRPPPRLALFSGHDTTLMPLMITLGPDVWDGEWTPYASMLIIEIHELIDGQSDRSIYKSGFAFRLLLNGKVLTSKLEGCPKDADLCDVDVLLEKVSPLAKSEYDCRPQSSHSRPALQESKALLSTAGGIVLVVTVVLLSCLLGSIITSCYLQRRFPWGGKNVAVQETGMALTRYHDDVTEGSDDDESQGETKLRVV